MVGIITADVAVTLICIYTALMFIQDISNCNFHLTFSNPGTVNKRNVNEKRNATVEKRKKRTHNSNNKQNKTRQKKVHCKLNYNMTNQITAITLTGELFSLPVYCYSDLNSSYEPALYSGLLYLTCASSIQLVLVYPPSCVCVYFTLA